MQAMRVQIDDIESVRIGGAMAAIACGFLVSEIIFEKNIQSANCLGQ